MNLLFLDKNIISIELFALAGLNNGLICKLDV